MKQIVGKNQVKMGLFLFLLCLIFLLFYFLNRLLIDSEDPTGGSSDLSLVKEG